MVQAVIFTRFPIIYLWDVTKDGRKIFAALAGQMAPRPGGKLAYLKSGDVSARIFTITFTTYM